MRTLTTQQIETLKKMDWVEANSDTNNNYFMVRNLDDQVFLDLTGVNLKELYDSIFLPVSNRIEYYKSNIYKNGEKFFMQYSIFVDGVEWAKSNFTMFVGDILGLYTPTEEPTKEPTEEKTDNMSEEEIIKKLSSVLTLATDNLDIDKITDLIDNNFADVSNRMREKFCENLEVDDIGECLKEDCVKDWIEHNPGDAYDRAIDNMNSYEIKDKIIDYLSDIL